MKHKCVFVIGPESSGSKLIAKIISHALNIDQYGEWNGMGWTEKGMHKVCHRSLPFLIPPQYPDIEKWIHDNQGGYDIFFVITTRDITLSEISRIKRFKKTSTQVQEESKRANEIICDVINSGKNYYIWSYETFMFLKKDYLILLYNFLGIDSDYMPALIDGNSKAITSGRSSQ